jgi:glutathione peroxidase
MALFRNLPRQLLRWATPLLVAGSTHAAPACPATLQHTLPRLQDEAPQALCQYAGRVLLVVNTASYCGFTDQYAGLEILHRRFQGRGFAVLGFPSNDFAQEGGSNRSIADFCANTYGVQFPMFAKSTVRGANASPFYRELARQAGSAPAWNFHKYLLDRSGRVVAAWGSRTLPSDPVLVEQLERELARPVP